MLSSCLEEHDELVPRVDELGLTKEIRDLVPIEILDEMIDLGMPINGGENPPSVEGTYFASPFILESSNRPSDYKGQSFADFEVTFYGQDNDKLEIMADYKNGPETGVGVGSFIVGNECEFSVFLDIEGMISGYTASFVFVLSGKLVSDGIVDLYYANFMVNDNGDPGGVFIENGEGRVIYDQDGFSEKVGTTAPWYEKLPSCPCTYEEAKALTEDNCWGGVWSDCGDANQDFHYGAHKEVRWYSENEKFLPGQQCTYDKNGQLITAGIAAGSPDLVSPRGCGNYIPDFVINILTEYACYTEHCIKDVKPWETKSCWEYLQKWPADNSCSRNNPVSDIAHMREAVGDMTCEEITLIIRKADRATNLDMEADLRDYILGTTKDMPKDKLISRLKNWKDRVSCFLFPNDDICLLIDKMIANLE